MLGLVLKRFLRRTSQLGSVSIVTCIFVAIIAFVFHVSTAIQNTAVARELAHTENSQGNLTVTFDGDLTTVPLTSLNKEVRSSLASLGVNNPMYFVTYRPMSNMTGETFHIVGVDPQFLTQQPGLAPDHCGIPTCSVSLLLGSDISLPSNFLKRGPIKASTTSIADLTVQEGATVYVTTDIQGLLSLPSLRDLSRTFVWTAPVDAEHIRRDGPQKSLTQMRDISNQFSLYSAHLILHIPEEPVVAAIAQSQAATMRLFRMLALGSLLFASALLLLAANARSSHEQTAAVWLHIRGGSAKSLAWLSAGVSVVPALVIAFPYVLVSPTAASLMIGFVVFVTLIVGIVLSDNLRIAVVALALTASGLALLTRDVALISALASIALVVLLNKVGTQLWKQPLHLATSRRPEMIRNSILIAMCTAVVTSWLATAHALDQQEAHHISYVSPLQSSVTGFTHGVFQNNLLRDYQKYGTVYPIETIPATSSGKGYSVENVQVVGIPSGIDLTNLSGIGGPIASQLAQLSVGDIAQSIVGENRPLRIQSVPARMQLGVWILDANNESELVTSNTVISSTTRILGVEVSQTSKDLERSQHAVGEGKHALVLPAGVVAFEFPDGQVVNTHVRLTSGAIYFPAGSIPDPLIAIVSKGLAKVGDTLVVNITAEQPVQLRVIGTANLFANAPQQFAVVDQAALNNYLANTRPEMIRSTRLWISRTVPVTDSAFTGLKVVNRTELRQEFLTNPIRRSTRNLYYGISGILVLLVLFFARAASRTVRQNSGISEWTSRGNKASTVHRDITRVLVATLTIQSLVAAIASYGVTMWLVAEDSITWAGIKAVPPLTREFSLLVLASTLLIVCTASILGILGGKMRHDH